MDVCVPQSLMPRISSTELFPCVIDDLEGHNQETPDEEYKRRCKASTSARSGTFENHNSGFTVQNRRISSSKVGWCDYVPGNSPDVLLLSDMDKPDTSFKGLGSKHEISKYKLGGADRCKGESSYKDGVESVKKSSHFAVSNMCPPGGDLEGLAEIPEEIRRENLLEFGWGNTNNMEDMDQLFPSTDSILCHDFDSRTEMLWELPSPTLGDSIDSIHQRASVPASQNLVNRKVTKDFDEKADSMKSKGAVKLGSALLTEGWKNFSCDDQYTVPIYDSHLPMQIDYGTDCSNESSWEREGFSGEGNKGSDSMQSETIDTLKEVNKRKVIKGKRHGRQVKRLEDNVQKSAGSRSNVTKKFSRTLTYVPRVPIAQNSAHSSAPVSYVSTCELASPMQGLQPVPHIHAGYGFPTQDLPVVIPTPSLAPQHMQPQGQPFFISYQPHFIDSPRVPLSNVTVDVLSHSASASSTMTPQEKIEKLRWRQKLQARLAVEQQQQQLFNQHVIPEQTQFGRGIPLSTCEEGLRGSIRLTQPTCDEPSKWKKRSLSVEGAMMEDGDESLTVSVLHQLLNIATKMDIRTRLCLRDGFCRLARNSMQRRAACDNQGLKKSSSELLHRSCTADSSSSSEQPSNQSLLTVDDIVETETNPMDRFIAHLLFHKRFHSPCTTSGVNGTPCNKSLSSEVDVLHQNAMAWKDINQLSYFSTATQSSSVNGEVMILNGQNSIPEVSNSDVKSCEKPELCLQQEKVLNIKALSADHTFQQFEVREAFVVDMDTGVPTGYLVSPDEVAEQLLQAN